MTFEVEVKEVKLHLVRNAALQVFPMMQSSIQADNLLVITNDFDDERDIHFIIRRFPDQGRILVKNDRGALIQAVNFTQNHINESRVFYEHNKPFSNLTILDSMNIQASNDHAIQSLDITFHVTISVAAMTPGGLDRYIQTEALTVDEGGTSVILNKNLNTSGALEYLRVHMMQGGNALRHLPSIYLQISKLPEFGTIKIRGKKAGLASIFTQADINNNFVKYYHDHSDESKDEIGISVLLALRDSGLQGAKDILLVQTVLPVSVLPINDQPFELITNSPSITVVQRQSRTITRDFLLTTDPDNPPEDLIYDIIKAPTSGRLVFNEDIYRDLTRFSQADIDRERVVFISDGSLRQSEFYFRVSDGQFPAVFQYFRIMVLPLELKVINQSKINIEQGTRLAHISSGNQYPSYTFDCCRNFGLHCRQHGGHDQWSESTDLLQCDQAARDWSALHE